MKAAVYSIKSRHFTQNALLFSQWCCFVKSFAFARVSCLISRLLIQQLSSETLTNCNITDMRTVGLVSFPQPCGETLPMNSLRPHCNVVFELFHVYQHQCNSLNIHSSDRGHLTAIHALQLAVEPSWFPSRSEPKQFFAAFQPSPFVFESGVSDVNQFVSIKIARLIHKSRMIAVIAATQTVQCRLCTSWPESMVFHPQRVHNLTNISDAKKQNSFGTTSEHVPEIHNNTIPSFNSIASDRR
jgi:hypothetical protein